MVIRPPYIDDAIETALEFLLMIGDIRGEIGGAPVPAHHHAVFLVTETAGLEPQGAFVFVDLPRIAKGLDAARHPPAVVKALLAEPLVEAHPEIEEVLAYTGDDSLGREPGAGHQCRFLILGQQGITVAGLQFAGQIPNVIALVALLREIDTLIV